VYSVKVYGGVEIQLHSLTSAVAGGEPSVSQSSHFTSRNTVHSTHLTGSWIGPRTGLDTGEIETLLSPAGNQTRIPWRSRP